MDTKSAVKISTGWLSIPQLTAYPFYKKRIVHQMMRKTGTSSGEANCFSVTEQVTVRVLVGFRENLEYYAKKEINDLR